MTYSVVLVSGVQQSESDIYIYIICMYILYIYYTHIYIVYILFSIKYICTIYI